MTREELDILKENIDYWKRVPPNEVQGCINDMEFYIKQREVGIHKTEKAELWLTFGVFVVLIVVLAVIGVK